MSRLIRHPFVTLGIIIVVAITALVVFRLSTGAKTDKKTARLITVGIVSPLRQDLDIRLAYTADISPNQVVNIFSRVDGYIARLHVDKGDFVRMNQLLLEIDHTDYQHAVNQAKANLSAAKAKVSQQNAVVRNAKLTFDRMQTLLKDQFVSQQDLDNAQVNFDAAGAAHASLQAQVNQVEVALAQAETNLAYSYIRAPFPGYIAERNLDTGAYVSSATASTSSSSATRSASTTSTARCSPARAGRGRSSSPSRTRSRSWATARPAPSGRRSRSASTCGRCRPPASTR